MAIEINNKSSLHIYGAGINISDWYVPPLTLITTNLVTYFDAANVSSYGGSGTSWNDISGQNRDATLTNGVIFSGSAGKSDSAMVFDGVDDYAIQSSFNLGTNPYLGDFTFNVWFRSPGNTGTKIMGVQSSVGGGAYDRHIYLGTDGRIRFSSFSSGQRNVSSSATTYGDNRWYNAAVTVGDGNIKLYVDGVFDSTISGSAYNLYENSYLIVGGTLNGYPFSNGFTSYWTGSISVVMVHDSVLNESDILNNYNVLKGRYGK